MQAYIFANLHKQIKFVNPRSHNLREFFVSLTILQRASIALLATHHDVMNGLKAHLKRDELMRAQTSKNNKERSCFLRSAAAAVCVRRSIEVRYQRRPKPPPCPL
jgi:hypothetical protein